MSVNMDPVTGQVVPTLSTENQQNEGSPQDQALNKLASEQFQELKLSFEKGKRLNNELFAQLYKVVKQALDENDLALAVNAAMYGVGWFGYIEVPEDASWNAILHKVVAEREFPPTDFAVKFLKPKAYESSSALIKCADKIWSFFQENHWDVPGCEVFFDAYGHNPCQKNPLCAWRVEAIRGEGYFLGFSGIQGRVEGCWDLGDIGGLSFIAVPGVVIRLYSDSDGLTLYKFHGDNWPQAIRAIQNEYWSPSKEDISNNIWSEHRVSAPGDNEIDVQDLFCSRAEIDQRRTLRRNFGLQSKTEIVNFVTSHLEVFYQYLTEMH